MDPGTRLGPYEIVAPLGAGGMGEVYRARDTRLDRIVAVKVLPSQYAADAVLRERFDREARAISSLNHPHICALYDVGREGDVSFLVLEYLEGETLADRLKREGAGLPVADALRIAIEICDALDKAHRAGIVHRDLKPANIFLARSGGASVTPAAKLLDFGLAKTAAPVVATSGLSMMPTTPHGVTAQGTILGTFQYMAPEQIEGLEADARSDIFAFGALLFEMLAGRPAFEGKTRASLLGAILKDEPARVSAVQPVAPAALDRIVVTCLAKDPDNRWQSARDLLRELRWATEGGPISIAPVVATDAPGRPSGARTAWIVVGVLALALAAAAVPALRRLRESPAPAGAIQFTIPAPDGALFGGPVAGGTGSTAQIAVSPDGRQVAFVAGGQSGFQLYVRPIESLVSRAIPGTAEASFPFWSPDSRFVGFFAGGKLKKVPLAGGPPIVLCDAANAPKGGTWNSDNVILFGMTSNTLQRVSGAGGVATPASVLDKTLGESSHRWPFFLPDGRHFVFTASTGTCCPPAKPAVIRLGTLDSTDVTTLFQVESSVQYAGRHLLFSSDGTLMAQPFDPVSRRIVGEQFPVADQIGIEGSRYAAFSVSGSGVLAYSHGVTRPTTRLTWVERSGKNLGTIGEPAPYREIALAPDDRRVAVSYATGTPENRDIWIVDAERGTMSRLTFDPGDDSYPVWSPDGSRVAFQGTRNAVGRYQLRSKLVAGTANDEPLVELSGTVVPSSWSADGRFVAYNWNQGQSWDVFVLPLIGDRKSIPIATTPFAETFGAFAPNGRWIAYQSNETGQTQVYVQPFPPTGGKYQVSQNGGTEPMWRSDGSELFFLSPEKTLISVTVNTANGFAAGVPQALFPANTSASLSGRQYAISRDGSRFLINAVNQQTLALPLNVVVNWLSVVQK